MNKAFFAGRLCSDCDIRYTTDGKPVAKFRFAVNRRFAREGEQEADFFSCIAFGKTAETMEKCSIVKGTKLLLDAEVRNNNYTDKEGKKHYDTQVVVNSFEFCESKQSGQSGNAGSGYNHNAGYGKSYDDGFMDIPDGVEDDSLPFN